MPDEKVIELSVAETNALRAKLGLAPLRTSSSLEVTAAAAAPPPASTAATQEKEVLSLSVDESNDLRAQLGLAPLKTSESVSKIVHKPAENEAATREAADRVQEAKLKREYEAGLQEFKSHSLTQQEGTGASTWAQQMRSTQTKQSADDNHENAVSPVAAALPKKDKKKKRNQDSAYDEADLKGLHVGHSVSDFEAGQATVLTLTDAPILQKDGHNKKIVGLAGDDDDGAAHLENVNLTDQQTRQRGLQEKRKMELGMGRAGGYAGFDDDEFEELGGTLGPSSLRRGGLVPHDTQENGKKNRPRGFAIGTKLEEEEQAMESDLFAGASGRAISLEPSTADAVASDFMTAEEVAAALSKKKKEPKFKKKQKKDKKKKKRRKDADEEEDDDDNNKPALAPPDSKGLLEELEATAVKTTGRRKRRRSDEGAEDDDEGPAKMDPMDLETKRRAKFDAIMDKGNERTRQAFQPAATKLGKQPSNADDEEPDDAFLNAALSKARRFNRLRAMAKEARGADAVAQAVQSSNAAAVPDETSSAGTITFSVDETREFTRALQAKMEQTQRKAIKKEEPKEASDSNDKTVQEPKVEEVEDVDLEELAKEMTEDPISSAELDGTTGNSAPVGRGLSSFLSVLKQTGEITKKNAGKEEMRGRAKDKRTYEDYEALDLNKVVKIDKSKANAKDLELAEREVKLEYRDKFGRLLTRKEAFRELSYQFHGKGSGLKNQEKKMRQIAQEQAQARISSRQAAEGAGTGSFGAQKATQKAAGKAFIVHKT